MQEAIADDVGYVDLTCSKCGGKTMDYAGTKDPVCFRCSNATNPFAQKNIRMSIDATGEDSKHPQRIREGTQGFNMALPPKVIEYGPKNAYGQRTVLRSRPVANNEVSSARRLRELAKRNHMTPQDTQKRAIGGR